MLNVGVPETFWLNVMNLALGVGTVGCILAILIAALPDLAGSLKKRGHWHHGHHMGWHHGGWHHIRWHHGH